MGLCCLFRLGVHDSQHRGARNEVERHVPLKECLGVCGCCPENIQTQWAEKRQEVSPSRYA